MNNFYAKAEQNTTSKKSLLSYLYTKLIPQTSMDLPLACDAHKKAIIVDLNGVLCTTNKLRAAQIIGLDVISAYIFRHIKLPNSTDLLKALDQVPALCQSDAYSQGTILPQIMIDWKTGLQDFRDIQDQIIAHITASNMTTAEKNLYIQTALMMTTPAKFIQTKQVILEGLQLIRQLKKLGYKIYILSNWDPSSFPLFVKSFPDFFTYEGKDLFDGIMISGQQHVVKPEAQIYLDCLSKFNISASQAIFIDDTQENIQAAEKLGIASILCINKNIAQVKKQLIELLTVA